MDDAQDRSASDSAITDRTARFLVDVYLNWSAYACIRCHEHMAAPAALLCADCKEAIHV